MSHIPEPGKKVKRQRKPRAPVVSEHVEAVNFWRMVKLHERKHPDLLMLFAVPNGGHRHAAVAAKMRAEGVRPGVSDYLALVPRRGYHGLAIELKSATGTASEEQREFIWRAKMNGYRAEIARGWVEAWRIVCEYFGIRGQA